jgi:acetoin utilization protein AcuB
MTPIEQAFRIMRENRVHHLPIVKGQDVLVGLITQTDLFYIFTEQLGARSTGVRLALQIEDVKGTLARLTGRICELGSDIVSLATLPGKETGRAMVTVKVEGVSQASLVEELPGAGTLILDARKSRGWGTPGSLPYHWTLEEAGWFGPA